jgi:transcriptional regulator with XRE-family HTH domain
VANRTVGGNIRRFREAGGLSQTDLADLVEVTQPAVSAWELGVAEPGLRTLRRLAGALRCNPADLLAGIKAA